MLPLPTRLGGDGWSGPIYVRTHGLYLREDEIRKSWSVWQAEVVCRLKRSATRPSSPARGRTRVAASTADVKLQLLLYLVSREASTNTPTNQAKGAKPHRIQRENIKPGNARALHHAIKTMKDESRQPRQGDNFVCPHLHFEPPACLQWPQFRVSSMTGSCVVRKCNVNCGHLSLVGHTGFARLCSWWGAS